jgi:large subunit ribosomal protein L15
MAGKLRLNEIRDNNGARRGIKVLGRGIGSGHGKTSCRGGKGQTARSGVSINGFEGGQTPIYRRLPKRGFVNIHRAKMYELDFFKIARIFNLVKARLQIDHVKDMYIGYMPSEDGLQIDKDLLVMIGYMPSHADGISLIANGKIDFPVKVCVARSSRKAKEMLEGAGGTLIVE